MSKTDATVNEKYYGGTVTVQGRKLITSLIAGDTIEFTRIVVGSGKLSNDVELIDMTDLVRPIAEGVSTIPTVKDNDLFMTVEYRNDLNGGLKESFWLNEFGIFAKTENSEEVLFYYATLGDSPQPVNAYKDNRIDIRRYPITISLAMDANVQITYNPGSFITSAEAYALLATMLNDAVASVDSVTVIDITIPKNGWSKSGDVQGSMKYPFMLELPCKESTNQHVPKITLHITSLPVAQIAGVCPTVESLDGVLRFYAKKAPNADMVATVVLLSSMKHLNTSGGIWIGGQIIPVASGTMLGGVRVQDGSGLIIDESGNLSVDVATEEEVSEMLGQISAKVEIIERE